MGIWLTALKLVLCSYSKLRCDGLATIGEPAVVPGNCNFCAVFACVVRDAAPGSTTSVKNRPIPPADAFCSIPGSGETFWLILLVGAAELN